MLIPFWEICLRTQSLPSGLHPKPVCSYQDPLCGPDSSDGDKPPCLCWGPYSSSFGALQTEMCNSAQWNHALAWHPALVHLADDQDRSQVWAHMLKLPLHHIRVTRSMLRPGWRPKKWRDNVHNPTALYSFCLVANTPTRSFHCWVPSCRLSGERKKSVGTYSYDKNWKPDKATWGLLWTWENINHPEGQLGDKSKRKC